MFCLFQTVQHKIHSMKPAQALQCCAAAHCRPLPLLGHKGRHCCIYAQRRYLARERGASPRWPPGCTWRCGVAAGEACYNRVRKGGSGQMCRGGRLLPTQREIQHIPRVPSSIPRASSSIPPVTCSCAVCQYTQDHPKVKNAPIASASCRTAPHPTPY